MLRGVHQQDDSARPNPVKQLAVGTTELPASTNAWSRLHLHKASQASESPAAESATAEPAQARATSQGLHGAVNTHGVTQLAANMQLKAHDDSGRLGDASEALLDAPSFALQPAAQATPDAAASPTHATSEASGRLPELPTIRLPAMSKRNSGAGSSGAGSQHSDELTEQDRERLDVATSGLATDSQPLFSFPSNLNRGLGLTASLLSAAPADCDHVQSLGLECSQSLAGAQSTSFSEELFKRSPAHAAALRGDAGKLRQLLAEKPAPQELWHEVGTPLHCAVQRNSSACIGACLEAALEVDAENAEGLTPLMVAAMMGHEAAMLALLDAGASIMKAHLPGSTENLLHFCVEHVRSQMPPLLQARLPVHSSRVRGRSSTCCAITHVFQAAHARACVQCRSTSMTANASHRFPAPCPLVRRTAQRKAACT